MANKPNPILAAFEAKLRREFAEEKAQMEAEYRERLHRNSELSMIAHLIAGSRLGFLGEKRADLLIEEQIDVKMQLAENLLKDAEDDKELTYTKADLARTLQQILGPDGWKKRQHLFTILRDYWVE